MKYISHICLTIVGALFLGLVIYVIVDTNKMQHTELYSGVIVGHIYEPPTSGYKSSQEAKYCIIMREDKSRKRIKIPVTVPTYYGLIDSCRASFTISNGNLQSYGNTTDATKNLYNQ